RPVLLVMSLPWALTLELSLAWPSFKSPTSAARPEMALLVIKSFKWSRATSTGAKATLKVVAAQLVKTPPL
ncbi:5640_t:CDS:1, partial [Ambispora gerdemannii]